MAQAIFRGVKNNSKTDRRVLTFDGVHYEFEPQEVRILPEDAALHATSRRLTVQNENREIVVTGQPYSDVPLDEALKVAKLEENPSVRQARKDAEAQERKEREYKERLKREVLAELRSAEKEKVAK